MVQAAVGLLAKEVRKERAAREAVAMALEAAAAARRAAAAAASAAKVATAAEAAAMEEATGVAAVVTAAAVAGATALGMGDLSTPGGSYRCIPCLHNSDRRA